MAGISRHWNLNSTESNLYENSDWFSGIIGANGGCESSISKNPS